MPPRADGRHDLGAILILCGSDPSLVHGISHGRAADTEKLEAAKAT
ncbi:MAG TPA: hypothetical protein VFS30_13910 [Dehalococcoidia bacterium]|nr:hypothetical protein [Dehalococcoidia bacterium]